MAKRIKYTCECCGVAVDDNTSPCTEEGLLYCQKCADEMALSCTACGSVAYAWEMTGNDHGDAYCEHCATAI